MFLAFRNVAYEYLDNTNRLQLIFSSGSLRVAYMNLPEAADYIVIVVLLHFLISKNILKYISLIEILMLVHLILHHKNK